ncbi:MULTISPECIES: hypothetical protein [unclassified Burkholderia]|uniref:hypothetical protein n=1 Tax=unclassified Burkholderia TaxID=2613784 RepID=UPI001E5DF933|nr:MULTISPECIES: hypothetical protein [unclassified Burkholderia]UEP32329.1 hypothetical protein LMA01_24545 [Burkholderia sp. B21-007]UEP45777.1 hypothetical protein LMA02_20235 [Burkholderia sp. B21-005]
MKTNSVRTTGVMLAYSLTKKFMVRMACISVSLVPKTGSSRGNENSAVESRNSGRA